MDMPKKIVNVFMARNKENNSIVNHNLVCRSKTFVSMISYYLFFLILLILFPQTENESNVVDFTDRFVYVADRTVNNFHRGFSKRICLKQCGDVMPGSVCLQVTISMFITNNKQEFKTNYLKKIVISLYI